MKRTLQYGLMAVFFACPLLANANSGVIHFRGSIVEEACRVNPERDVVHVSCFRDGKQQRETQSLREGAQFTMMQHLATAQVYSVADHPDLQVLQITYR
ncbi:hypothetical protein [Pseudocitrobacter faecalis]|uniref:hypothetical protein n=1 Tax=Pseudocitrobacter faecalis TaxID=1398493 RepID=UPI003BA1A5A6